MAVTDDRIYHPTDALILKKPRRHYRVGLRCEHWQLRSQIGLSSAQHVYYVGGSSNTQVHRLDTAAHESEVVKLLTFVPRCLVARNGWVCCGGENGEFVGFRVSEDGESIESSERDRGGGNHLTTIDPAMSSLRQYIESGGASQNALDAFHDHTQGLSPDDRLQLALDAAADTADSLPPLVAGSPRADANSNINSTSTGTGYGNGKCLVARSKTFGRERVNCITLWFPPGSDADRARGAYSQSVAVLANNDKHVTIVGLDDQESIDELSYPDYVNRALISPDGRLLVAICDDPYLYIHERVPQQQKPTGQGLFTRKDVVSFEWKLCAKTHLKSQRKDDHSDQRGSFAACFSSTGRYLAVGTQYGVISVFEAAAFTEGSRDPLITTFESSRPQEDYGAIRDMAFCPGPFDLLAWTEHRGHIGVADVRSNYASRQILDLNGYDEYDHVLVTERGSIDPRLLERNERGELALADPSESAAARRAARRPPTDYHPPLNADETMILEALMEQRRRRDQAAATRSTSAVGTRLIERLQSRITSNRESLTSMSAARNNGTSSNSNSNSNSSSSSSNNSNNNNQRVSDLAEIHRESLRDQSERARARRHAEAHVVHAERAANVAATLRVLRTQVARAQQNLESYRADSPATNSSTDPDNLSQSTSTFDVFGPAPNYEPGAGDSSGERPRDYLASVWSTILRHRDHQEAADTTLSRMRAARMGERAAAMNTAGHQPDDTAGLAWSDDGRTLIIGAEDGIYEFHVDLFSRKLFPSLTMR